ncbi:MAG: phosphoenolpyruvate--protein phosphotransferase [Chloroflexi bacterium]|nr:phosphoenolpyruvate--protein phosphotransferase [Chloroflexota bacterium]
MSKELRGIPAARGLARGVALKWMSADLEIPRFTPDDLAAEKARLAKARQEAKKQLHALSAQVSQQVGDAEAALFEAQAMFLTDVVLVSRAETAIETGMNAEQAWHQACEYFAAQLENLPDETLSARSVDVRDVGRRVIENLLGVHSRPLLTSQTILLARDLTPSQTASLDKTKISAFCTVEGGPTSHTAILARALGIPAVVGVGDEILEIADGTLLLVDGTAGLVVSNPPPDLLADFDKRIQSERELREQEAKFASQPAVTIDGHRVEVAANVGSVDDARKALEYGADGIGLLRTEFLFLNRSQAPGEQTQFAVYSTILALMGTRPVVVRTLDVGGDKEVPYYDFGIETNPFLGYRAIRLSLDHPEDFKSQLRALLRAGTKHDLRIMFPMIATLAEVRQAKKLLDEARGELQSKEVDMAKDVQVGIMVEIPAVALLADRFAPEVDFFSIGTNDLTQYTFAAERGNKRVSHLHDPCHPAILRQIKKVVRAAHAQGKWVGVCGEMAGDLQAIPVLLGLGVDELSMSPVQIPSAKRVICNWSLVDAQKLAERVLDLDDAEAVRKAVG